MKITPRVLSFIELVVEGVNNSDAYRRCYNVERLKAATIHRAAHDLRHDPDVTAEIDKRLVERRAASIRNAADVANEFLRIGFADPGEIVQHRRLCCRFCHGDSHAYQWRDEHEFNEAMRAWENDEQARLAAKGPKRKGRPQPTDLGGYGFKANASPHPECPKCDGEGTPDVFIADTTKMSPEQRRLIERVKVTKEGIEIRFRNQSDALTKAGQMLGGFKQTVVLQNPDGSPVNAAPTVVALTADEAAAKYKEWMDNGGTKE